MSKKILYTCAGAQITDRRKTKDNSHPTVDRKNGPGIVTNSNITVSGKVFMYFNRVHYVTKHPSLLTLPSVDNEYIRTSVSVMRSGSRIAATSPHLTARQSPGTFALAP